MSVCYADLYNITQRFALVEILMRRVANIVFFLSKNITPRPLFIRLHIVMLAIKSQNIQIQSLGICRFIYRVVPCFVFYKTRDKTDTKYEGKALKYTIYYFVAQGSKQDGC